MMNFLQEINNIKVQIKKKIINGQQGQNWHQTNTNNFGLNNVKDWFTQGALLGMQWAEQQKHLQEFQLVNSNDNVFNNMEFGKMIEHQLIYMQPSPAQKKLKQIQKRGEIFVDQRFPPNLKSLTGQFGHISEWKSITWKRISQIIPHPKIFQGKVQPNDIAQGYLGDCYFLAGLAALAEKPERIFNLFLITEQNSSKYYSVKILYKGKWVTVDMDEYIPVLYNQPAFSKSKNKEIWVILLEKAWAKLYTSYKRIDAGYAEQPLHDLTGAPIRQISLKSYFDKQKEWKYLMMATQRCYSMVTSSQPGSDSTKSATGVVQGHAYTLIGVYELNFQNHYQRLVKIRNPWGKTQGTGAWSDNDSRWNYISPQDKNRLRFSNNTNDGVFFISYDEFTKQFRSITVAEINDNASYVYLSHKDRNKQGCYFKIQVLREGRYSLQMDKTPQRSFPQSKWDSYRYPNAILQIGKIGYSNQKMEGVQSASRTLFKQYILSPGQYIVKARIQFNSQFQKDYDVNLAIYADYPPKLSFASNKQACEFMGKNVQWSGQPDQSSQNNWNNLGNIEWGNNNSNGWETMNNNNGLGNNNNNNNNNNGWGNNNNNGWGNNNNNGWSNNNNGWENESSNNNSNNGWNSNNNTNNTWGNNSNNNNSNDGWGDYFQKKPNNNNPSFNNTNNQFNNNSNDGWGDYFDNKNNNNNNIIPPNMRQPNNNLQNQNNQNNYSNPKNPNNNKFSGWGPGWQ